MGLDMYLSKRTYVQNWEHTPKERRHQITVKRGGKVRKDIKASAISYVIESVAYWRKANAIHRWFVQNCQGGVDNCQTSEVSHAQIKELVALCRKVLETAKLKDGMVTNGYTVGDKGQMKPILQPGKVIANPEEVSAILPTQSGFFFGSTDYNEWYLEDLKETVKMLGPYADAEEVDGTFEYHASW